MKMKTKKKILGVNVSYPKGSEKFFKEAHNVDLDTEIKKFIKQEKEKKDE